MITLKYRCTYCGGHKMGRFRRPQENPNISGLGWSRGRQMVTWICDDCERSQRTGSVIINVKPSKQGG